MVLGAFKHGKIPVMRDGTQWRPFVHVKDTSRAFIIVMESPKEKVNGQIFNVGSDEQNLQIFQLAKMIKDTLEIPVEIEWYGSPDKRSYRVSFNKIKSMLNFKPKYTPKDGIMEVYEALKNGKVEDTIKTRTVEWYKHLLETRKLLKEVLMRDVIL